MDYLIAAAFGLALGTLIAAASFPVARLLPAAAGLVVVAVVVAVTLDPDAPPWFGVVLGLSILVGSILADGVLWKEHPLLAGSGYWTRVWLTQRYSRGLRTTLSDEPHDSDPGPHRAEGSAL